MTHSERKHARFAPSSAHRWVNCPGSVSLAEQFASKSSPAADEGTAAHQVAERCLEKGWDVADHYTTDNKVRVRDGVDIPVTEDMIEGVQLYLDHVREVFDECDEFAIEARLDMSHIHPEFFGTGDAIGINELEGVLHVIDFKFGRKAVDPVRNWQAISYAIGAKRKYHNKRINKIVVHIIQPRVSKGALLWETTPREIDVLGIRIEKSIGEAVLPEARFEAGDWCAYCPAASACPTLRSRANEIAQDEFGAIKPVVGLGPEALAKVLSEIDVLEDWCSRVRAHAFDMATSGKKIPGFKLVQRRAVRKWADEDAAYYKLRGLFAFGDDELYEKKFLSPAKVEKMLSKADRKRLDDLVIKASSGITLVPDSDKRAAVSPDAAEEFSKVEIDDD